jgi:hypothetical protein
LRVTIRFSCSIPAEAEVGAAMGTLQVEHRRLTLLVAEEHELLAQRRTGTASAPSSDDSAAGCQ